MKRFKCRCGQPVFYENTTCIRCGEKLGFSPLTLQIHTLYKADGKFRDHEGTLFRLCRNRIDHANCNWLLPGQSKVSYCQSCRLNRTIPNLSTPQNEAYWSELERAKRRLLYTLLALGLPVTSKKPDWPYGLAFDFIEDQRSNPNVDETFVSTGHKNGVITINVAEADDVTRAMTRKHMLESYRTLLGHFRHESGHYYFEILLSDREAFRSWFGDERSDYNQDLANYYASGPPPDWRQNFISAYAAAHPLEDWAETWAHYLHIVDSMDTAHAYGLAVHTLDDGFADGLTDWMQLTVILNELNRSMGMRDPYPFVITTPVAGKLQFIHQVIHPVTN